MVKDPDDEKDQVAVAMDPNEGEDQACDKLLKDQEEVPVRHRGSHPCRRIHCRQMPQ